MNNNDIAFIYNHQKAQFFIREGHNLIGKPKPASKGDVCYKFKKDEKLLKTTEKWKKTMNFIQKIKNN
jgi:hypothetical protein